MEFMLLVEDDCNVNGDTLKIIIVNRAKGMMITHQLSC